MKYIQLMAYGSVIGNFLYKSFRKLSFQITGKKETVLRIHYSTSVGTPMEEVVIILYVGKLVDIDGFKWFMRKIDKCVTAPGWRMDEVVMRDMIPTSRWGDDMDGLDRCLLDQHEIDKFKDAYYVMMGASCD